MSMHSPARALATMWIALLLVVIPLGRIGAQSPSPSAAPAPESGITKEKVTSEVDQYVKFLASLSRGKLEGDKAQLAVLAKPDMAAKTVSLEPGDLAHVKKHREQLEQLVVFGLLPADKKGSIAAAFDAMLAPLPATSDDAKVAQYDAEQKYVKMIGTLADELDAMKNLLNERQKEAGLSISIPSLGKPKPSAVPSPPAPPPPVAGPPPPLPDGDAPAQGADAGDPGLPPCTDARERVNATRRFTQSSIKPVDALVGAGDRALRNRYFTLARDALEKAAERLVELERDWRDIADSLKPPAYSNRDLLDPNCTDVLTTALTNAIAINDQLQRVYPKLGEAYSALGQHEQAAREIAKSVEINPENAKTWSALGYAFLRSDQADESIKAFLRSVELDTYVPEVWLGLAKAYARKNENQLAIHYIRRAISKGYVKFEKLAADPDFATLQGISEFDDLVYLVPGAQPFPR